MVIILRPLWAFIASFELSLVALIVRHLIYGSAGKVTLPDGEVSPADSVFVRKEADDLFLERESVNLMRWEAGC